MFAFLRFERVTMAVGSVMPDLHREDSASVAGRTGRQQAFKAPAFLVGIVMALSSGPLLATTPAGEVVFTHGEVRLYAADNVARPAHPGAEIFAGDTLKTGPASSVRIRFTDGGNTAVRPDSEYRIDDYHFDTANAGGSRSSAELVRGGLRVITGAIADHAPANVRYDTPVATMGLRGTTFQLLHVDGDGQVILDGSGNLATDARGQGVAPSAAARTVEPGTYLKTESGEVSMTTAAGTRNVAPGLPAYAASADDAPVLRSDAEAFFPAPEADLETDPLRVAVVQAINTNPEVQERWHAYLAAEEGRNVARGGYFPEIDVQLFAGRQYQESSRDGRLSRDPLRATLTLNQMLYDGFLTRSEVARLGHAQMVRYYELLGTSEQVALEAIRAYADVERYRELVTLAEENLAAHRGLYDQVLELVETGVGRGVDLEQATGRLALAEANLLTEISNLHDVSARFLRVVGRTPSEDFVEIIGALPDEMLPETMDQAVVQALASNPAMFAAVEGVSSAREQVGVARSHYHPQLDFQARQSRDNALQTAFGADDDRWVTDTRFGVTLDFNLFRGLSDQARIAQFTEETKAAQQGQENVCRTVRQDVATAFNDVQVLDERLVYLDQHQLSSDRVRTAYLQQFNIGQRTLLDLLDTENELFEARRAYVNGQFDREVATARTLAGMGHLLPALKMTREGLPVIEDETRIDPDQICPPLAPRVVEVERNSLFR